MKYLESYKQNKRTVAKLNKNIVDIRNNFVSGRYIVFVYSYYSWENKQDVEKLIFGQIGNIEHKKEISERGDAIREQIYVKVRILDFIEELKEDHPNLNLFIGSTKSYSIDNNKDFTAILYSSNSKLETEINFNRFKEKYEVTWMAKKYNIV